MHAHLAIGVDIGSVWNLAYSVFLLRADDKGVAVATAWNHNNVAVINYLVAQIVCYDLGVLVVPHIDVSHSLALGESAY